MPLFAKQRLYRTADDKITTNASEAAFLFAGEGDEIPVEDAQKYGLGEPLDPSETVKATSDLVSTTDPAQEEAVEEAKAAEKPEDKAAAEPANKARKTTKAT